MQQTIIKWLVDTALLIDQHALAIYVVTGVTSLIFAIVILLLRSRTVSVTNWRDWAIDAGDLGFWRAPECEILKSRDWAKWLGWGFAFFAFSYLLLASLEFAQSRLGSGPLLYWLIRIIGVAGSGLHNLCFLAAARSLRERRPLLPKWSWCLFAASLIGLIPELLLPFSRIPDAVFSCICFVWVGYAMATNISTRRAREKVLVNQALLIAMLYVMAQAFYAFSPILISYKTQSIAGTLDYHVPALVVGNPQLLFDNLVIAFLLPLKFGFFIMALMVQLREIIILSSVSIKRLLANFTSSRKDFFGGEGFLKHSGEIVDADVVELALLLPGTEKRSVLSYKWESEKAALVGGRRIAPLSSFEDSEIGKVIRQGVEVVWRNGQEFADGVRGRKYENKRKIVVAAVPVKFQGAVIGCLRVECPGKRDFSAISMTHLRVMADLAALAAQPERELAAADEFSSRFAEWRVSQPKIEVENGVEKIAELLQDVLSPRAVVVQSDIGFQSCRKISGKSKLARILREQCYSDYTELVRISGGMIEMLEIDLEAGTLDVIGKLALVVPAHVDDLSYPTLGANHLIRHTIGALVADAIIDINRDYFAYVLKDLAVNLNGQQWSSTLQWFDQIEKAAKQAGLLWVVVTDLKDLESLGDPKWVDAVHTHQQQISWTDAESANPQVLSLSMPIEQTRCIISLCLPATKTKIWLGVGRKRFGSELTTPSPWTLFLERFSDIADSTLVRMTATQEMLRLQIEAADAQGLSTAAVTAETLFHQLMNMVRDIANPVAVLNYSLLTGELSADKDLADLIRMTGQSAERLLDFASEFMKVTKLGTDRPCSLLEAAQQSNRFYLQALNRYEIKLEINIAPDLTVDVPFHVASLAIANLVSNAKDALKARRGGVISIEARDEGKMIHCCVTDNGSGIDPSLRERLFEIGATTKPGSGGWGLYLVKRSLVENRGNIDLVRTGADGTQFLIRFPKPR